MSTLYMRSSSSWPLFLLNISRFFFRRSWIWEAVGAPSCCALSVGASNAIRDEEAAAAADEAGSSFMSWAVTSSRDFGRLRCCQLVLCVSCMHAMVILFLHPWLQLVVLGLCRGFGGARCGCSFLLACSDVEEVCHVALGVLCVICQCPVVFNRATKFEARLGTRLHCSSHSAGRADDAEQSIRQTPTSAVGGGWQHRYT